MECIVRFQVIYKDEEPKNLRGLIMVGDKQEASTDQLIPMFKKIGFDVMVENKDDLTFKPVRSDEPYTRIRVTELDTGEEVYREDANLRQILENLMPRSPGL